MSYQLLADPANSLQSEAIPLRGVEPPTETTTLGISNGGSDGECEMNGSRMRSPKKSILKRTQKSPEHQSERALRVTNSRVLFSNDFEGRRGDEVY